MVSANTKLGSLSKILRQEKAGGFQDSTVIGGLDRFLQRWADELRPVLGDLSSYSVLTPPQREKWSVDALARLADGASASDVARRLRHPAPRRSDKKRLRPLSLDDTVSRLRGVSTQTLARLRRLDVEKVGDLLYLFPRRHNDFANISKVCDLAPGLEQTVVVTVWEASLTAFGRKRKSTQAVLGDDTGNVRAVWFNNPYMARTLRPGAEVVLSGRVNVFRGQFVFESPEYELLKGQEELVHTGRLVPVYPLTERLPQRTLRQLVKQALDACISQLSEYLPDDLIQRTGLLDIQRAMVQAHYPDSRQDWGAARRRLAFDELFLMQLALLIRKRQWREEGEAASLNADLALINAFHDSLPFSLTAAQRRTLDEIIEDLKGNRPMSRLLQGEVGSGKTVVAASALLLAAFSGYQGALMAPTEILAEQHFITISQLLSAVSVSGDEENLVSVRIGAHPRPVTVGLLIGGLAARAKGAVRRLLAEGGIDIVIGTQALIQEPVEIPRLALVVVDEQHRFGVMQRSSLRSKGQRPHLLAMSATPIPRSLALTLYGDLDISVIDELPAGRQQIRSRWVDPARRDAAYNLVRKEAQAGRQAFIVCPLVEESEAVQSRAAVEEYQRLSTKVFPELGLGLLHGRMPLGEKEQVMQRFRRGELDILVCTPVVEVGIDVPNATVMLIDGADRFGLAQLHQFRGRVGRGHHQSYCLLLADSPGEEARERLRLVERIQDGFQLAEEDLRLRGPGDYLGTRQSGLPNFRVASITDQDILSMARREAMKLLQVDPALSREGSSRLRERLTRYIAGIS